MNLERVPIPQEDEAQERAWRVVAAAYERRAQTPRRVLPRWAPIGAAAALAVVAAVLSPAGRSVVREARRAIGVERAAPALFRLPAPGRLLAIDQGGAWVVSADGSKRLLGPYDDASWSPHGLFVVATRDDELATLEPGGRVHWTLARPRVRFARWGGTQTDTRIAYVTRSRLHVVAGDGTEDVDAGGLPAAGRVAPAWRPGPGHVVAYADARGDVLVYDANAGALVRRLRGLDGVRSLAWSPDARSLAVADARGFTVFDVASGRGLGRPLAGIVGLAFGGDGRLAILRRRELLLADSHVRLTRVFAASGPFSDLAWSPDSRWLLVSWPAADEWVFVRTAGRHRVAAVANVARQFESFPRLGGWCCAR